MISRTKKKGDFEDIISALPELKDISVTTNDVFLSERAAGLAKSGLDMVNISLPSLNKEHYEKITGSSNVLPFVLDGIDGAIDFSARYDGNVILQLIELMNFKHISHYMVEMDYIERMLESRAIHVYERRTVQTLPDEK